MSFPWLHPQIPAEVTSRFPAQSLAIHRRELRDRASMLRRLGYSRDESLRRLQSYQWWEYEPFHRSPLLDEVAKLVDEVYQTSTPRTSNLTPGV